MRIRRPSFFRQEKKGWKIEPVRWESLTPGMI
uniref:Uncharacterized protein n=1 Tax=Rhizophora mucronata TaxID=61149 RepID=A0A2P2QS78_RHIMU